MGLVEAAHTLWRTLGLVAACSLAGCSLGTTTAMCTDDTACEASFGSGARCLSSGFCEPPGRCDDSADCREALGVGQVCGSEGVCIPITIPDRCTETEPADLWSNTRLTEHIIVGNIMDRSVVSQRAREQAARLAVMQANDLGGLDDRPLGVVFCNAAEDSDIDDQTRTDAAVASATWLADAVGVAGIVGPASSNDTLAVFDAIRDQNTVVMSPSATSPALTGVDAIQPTDERPGLLWRTAAPDSIQGRVIALDMRERKVMNVAAVNEIGPYGDELVRVFEEEFARPVLGIKFESSDDLADVVDALAETDVEEVLFVSSQTAHVVDLVTRLGERSETANMRIFITDSAASAEFVDAIPADRVSVVRGTRPQPSTGAIFTAFAGSYELAFGESIDQLSFVAHAYDAMWLILYGLAFDPGSELDGSHVARGLRRMSTPGIPIEVRCPQWPVLKQAFREGLKVDVIGASGDLDYAPQTEEISAPVEVWHVSECGGDRTIRMVELGKPPPGCE